MLPDDWEHGGGSRCVVVVHAVVVSVDDDIDNTVVHTVMVAVETDD